MTGEAAAAVDACGQNMSYKLSGRALRMLALSCCRRLPSPLMLSPSLRTRLLRKLITIGATIAINVDITPGRKPDSMFSALLTAFSELPNRPDSRRFPVTIKEELESEIPLAA